MDWQGAIEKNREALRRVLAMLVAMAGMGADAPATLPRRIHRAVLRLLRPAESATRRLIVIAARRVTAPPPRPRHRKPRRTGTAFITRPGRTGILLPHSMRPRPAPRFYTLPLLDALPRPGRVRRPVQVAVPRISFPGFTTPHPVAPRHPPMAWDPIDAGRLRQRVAAIASVLDDLPRHALRLARWRARRDAAHALGKAHRLRPIRPGPAPGWKRRPTHEVHDVLTVLHGLAFDALERPDTS